MFNVDIAILGNKTDKEAERKVEREEVEKFCQAKNIRHFEVSAKNGEHVTDAFYQMSEELTNKYPRI